MRYSTMFAATFRECRVPSTSFSKPSRAPTHHLNEENLYSRKTEKDSHRGPRSVCRERQSLSGSKREIIGSVTMLPLFAKRVLSQTSGKVVFFSAFWFAAICFGYVALLRYESRPDEPNAALRIWPAQSKLPLNENL